MYGISKTCTACGLCLDKCPESAIRLVENERRELVSFIDNDKCIKCGLCSNICPEINHNKFNKTEKCYAAWTKDERDYSTTSSGGIATLISKWCVNNGGVVYGAEMQLGGSVKHNRIDSIREIEQLKGSKYVQSNFCEVHRRIKLDISDGRLTVIIGTPCQLASILESYSEAELKNVYLIDLVCHGVPPASYLEEYLNDIIGDGDRDSVTVSFRKKQYMLKVHKRDQEIYTKKCMLDPYYRSFLEGLIFRENCYECKYARPERISDITLCDFWGLKKETLKNISPPENISGVLINTTKGRWLMDNCKNQMEYEEREINEVIEGNDNLNHPSTRHPDRFIFSSGIERGMKFSDSINNTRINNEIKREIIIELLRAPYRIIRHIYRFVTLKRQWNV